MNERGRTAVDTSVTSIQVMKVLSSAHLPGCSWTKSFINVRGTFYTQGVQIFGFAVRYELHKLSI
jgi:hypothetical protein